ncbi:MAG: PilZ domain-containing protein [Bacillota bacterium]
MTDQTRESQKRSDFRSGISYPIWYRDLRNSGPGGEWARTSTKDLSGGGASFSLVDDRRLLRRTGDTLEVQVILPPTPVFAIAKIVRIFQDDDGSLCAGVMFVSVAPKDKDRIVRVVLNEGLEKSW